MSVGPVVVRHSVNGPVASSLVQVAAALSFNSCLYFPSRDFRRLYISILVFAIDSIGGSGYRF